MITRFCAPFLPSLILKMADHLRPHTSIRRSNQPCSSVAALDTGAATSANGPDGHDQ